MGKLLYARALALARGKSGHNVTLNVWCCNPGAPTFYEAMGLVSLKIGLERLLQVFFVGARKCIPRRIFFLFSRYNPMRRENDAGAAFRSG